MKNLDKPFLLFIEPKENCNKPIIDSITKKITWLYRNAIKGTGKSIDEFILGSGYFGWHSCICGCRSSGCDYLIQKEYITNSLCIHYVACHRDEIPIEQLQLINSLTTNETDPLYEEVYNG